LQSGPSLERTGSRAAESAIIDSNAGEPRLEVLQIVAPPAKLMSAPSLVCSSPGKLTLPSGSTKDRYARSRAVLVEVDAILSDLLNRRSAPPPFPEMH
jgi:hypothetical protein